MSALPEIDYSKLSPGIRDTVMLLRSHGFETCDSGDGSNHAAGMKGATPFPMVAVRVGASMMAFNADSLRQLLIAQGVVFGDGPNDPRIEASYDPHNGVAMVLLSNVLIPGPLACPMCAPQCLPEEAAPVYEQTKDGVSVVCGACGMQGPRFKGFEDMENAKAHWDAMVRGINRLFAWKRKIAEVGA